MDFPFDLSTVFPASCLPEGEVVVRLGEDLLPASARGGAAFEHRFAAAAAAQRAAEVVDAMGAASASAQGLRAPITTAARARCHPEHAVYLMLDRESNAGLGSVVGMLKVKEGRGTRGDVRTGCL